MKKLVFIAVLIAGMSIVSAAAAGGLSFSLGFSGGTDVITIGGQGHGGHYGHRGYYNHNYYRHNYGYYERSHRPYYRYYERSRRPYYRYRSYRYGYEPGYSDGAIIFRFFFDDRHDYGHHRDTHRHRHYYRQRHYYGW